MSDTITVTLPIHRYNELLRKEEEFVKYNSEKFVSVVLAYQEPNIKPFSYPILVQGPDDFRNTIISNHLLSYLKRAEIPTVNILQVTKDEVKKHI